MMKSSSAIQVLAEVGVDLQRNDFFAGHPNVFLNCPKRYLFSYR